MFIGLLTLNFVSIYCFRVSQWPSIPFRLNLLSGLAVGQLTLVALWLATRQRHDTFSFVIPAAFLATSSYLRFKIGFFRDFTLFDYFCRNLLQALVPLVILWPVVRIRNWRRSNYRFSIGSVVWWTTCVAILIGLLRQATWSDGKLLATSQWMGIFAPGLLAITVYLVQQAPVHNYFKLLFQAWCGVLVGYLLALVAGKPFLDSLLKAEFATQAAIVGIGLELGRSVATSRIENANLATEQMDEREPNMP